MLGTVGWLFLAIGLALFLFGTVMAALSRPRVLHVNPIEGDDATGIRGNDRKPFATLDRAVLAARSGDEIRLSGGLHTISSPIVVPQTITRLTIVGPGKKP